MRYFHCFILEFKFNLFFIENFLDYHLINKKSVKSLKKLKTIKTFINSKIILIIFINIITFNAIKFNYLFYLTKSELPIICLHKEWVRKEEYRESVHNDGNRLIWVFHVTKYGTITFNLSIINSLTHLWVTLTSRLKIIKFWPILVSDIVNINYIC